MKRTAPLRLREQAHDRLQRGRLAGAVAAHQRHHLAAADLEASTSKRICAAPYQAFRARRTVQHRVSRLTARRSAAFSKVLPVPK